MKKFIKYSLIALVFFLCLVGIGIFALDRMFAGACGNEIFKEVLAPGGNYKAILFQRDCGATTGFSTQISLIDADDDLPNDGGNIYVIDGHPKKTNLEMVWTSPTSIVISNTTGQDTFKEETVLKGVQIVYR